MLDVEVEPSGTAPGLVVDALADTSAAGTAAAARFLTSQAGASEMEAPATSCGELKEPPWLTVSVGLIEGPGRPQDSEACLSKLCGLANNAVG